MSFLDRLILQVDRALRAVAAVPYETRPVPAVSDDSSQDTLSEAERRHAGALMRINHVGEVCAQALYQAQALATRRADLRLAFEEAAREENDHLAWTASRLRELGSRPSVLNPLWYAGAFALGYAAGKAGDALSLGFVAETERQVERHLTGHLQDLPAGDRRSRAIVLQMRDDEVRHGKAALAQGAAPLPEPVKTAMGAAARVMTTTAYYL